MGIKRTNMQGAIQATTVKWEGEEAKVTYRPAKVTPALMDEVISAEEQNKGHNAVTELLEEILVDWEVEEDDGTQVPITSESLSGMPLSFLMAIVTTIQEDMGAGKAQSSSASG